ncbi:hypothetical protein EMIHUDRAFT_225334 [Emiliania huxleyi CCMP1516]|uniref:Uncharacterized protein n=2 Tax=Emiliania huxleyi TaxID=2903 RepID=A0A0D3KP01_EMIH1|nr:hypothetical protein EMIHUDRAFT_225334 [Emiliania huxleyi CCMP1516]EOD37486.1 hypothetical protein EMIHUDRAFT_225334 [Emiliania huxleyi CCMP1516]|eukprot:XP_005789915.1 hypothetical protein EMIHUDRAFT_225334 [Emiliania huxleyi CCMP1516]
MHGDRFRKTICPNVVPSPFIACGEDIWQAEPLEVNGGKVEEVMKSSRRGEVDAAFRKKALELLDNTGRFRIWRTRDPSIVPLSTVRV